jgi:hypothetical protein
MNTTRNAAAAAWFSATLDLGRSFGAGIKAGYSNNFSDIAALELAAQGRWYFLSLANTRFFAQAELGVDFIFYQDQTLPFLLGGLALGWRLPLGSWYLEPVLRGGYPYLWGAGLGFGRRISL